MRYIKLFEEFNEIEQILAHFVEETGADRFIEVDFFKGSDIMKVYEIEFDVERIDEFYRTFNETIKMYTEPFMDLGYAVETTMIIYNKRYTITLYKSNQNSKENLEKACSDFIIEKYNNLKSTEVEDPYGDGHWIVYSDDKGYVFRHRDGSWYLRKMDIYKEKWWRNRQVTFNFEVFYPFEFYVGLLIGQLHRVFKPLLEEYGLGTSDESVPYYYPFSDEEQDDHGFV
jgi:hypothetical protein